MKITYTLFILAGVYLMMLPIMKAYFKYPDDEIENAIDRYLFDMSLQEHDVMVKTVYTGLAMSFLGAFGHLAVWRL